MTQLFSNYSAALSAVISTFALLLCEEKQKPLQGHFFVIRLLLRFFSHTIDAQSVTAMAAADVMDAASLHDDDAGADHQ
jgi:hypothetical protein